MLSERDNDGHRKAIGQKCGDIDTTVPDLLGVSRAVLDAVIFTHQEDSYWPLQEPAGLKKKLDDVFASTDYTKAVTFLKGIRKDRATDVKLMAENLNFLQHKKDKAVECQ